MTRFALQRGNVHGGNDDRADRWYIVDGGADAIDKRGAGFATRAEALDELVRRLQDRLPDEPERTLVGVFEIANRAGVAVATVHSWRRRHPEFPEPVVTLAAGPVWRWADVEAWTHTLRQGRPRKG